MGKKLEGIQWLKEQLRKIEESTSPFNKEIVSLRNISKGVYNDFHEWTPLKLAVFNYTLDIYTKIARKYFSKIYFFDLFAGSGINKLKNNDFVIGSPFIAFLNHKKDYEKFLFCEYSNENKDKKNYSALKKRLDYFKTDKILIYNHCCNEILNSILTEIDQNVNNSSFIFIDPYCMEFNWESMKKVLNLKSDILLTFMSNLIYNRCVTKERGKEDSKKLDEFFGNNSWKKANSPEELIEIYKSNILKVRPNAIMENIKITSVKNKGFCYEMLFITNKTKGNNNWMNAIHDLKLKIEKNSDEMVRKSLDMLKRGQTSITDW